MRHDEFVTTEKGSLANICNFFEKKDCQMISGIKKNTIFAGENNATGFKLSFAVNW